MVSAGEAEDVERWGGRAAPTNDARERRADIPNGERALARFGSWHGGARGTLYVSRSYAVFASARARVLVPLCGVCRVRAARGVELAADDGATFTFSLTRRDDLRCALRLLSVLAQRARSGAHLTPQPAAAALAIAASAGEPLPARGLDFESRSRHRRRSSKSQRRRARAPAVVVPATVAPVTVAPEIAIAEDDLIVAAYNDDDDASTESMASSVYTPMYRTDQRIADAKRKLREARDKLFDARNKLTLVEKRARAAGGRAGAKAGAIARTVAKSEVGRWSVEHALDIALCVVALIAVIVAVITLRMAEVYTLHLRLLGVSVMSMSSR